MKLTKPTFNFKNILKKTSQIFFGTLSASMLLAGGLGLFLSYINPIPWIAEYFPISFAGIYITGEQAFQEIRTWQATPVISAALSSVLIFLALMLHVNNKFSQTCL